MRNLKVALVAACAIVVGCGFAASADIPASAYVQDGLVVQYDGFAALRDGKLVNAVLIAAYECFRQIM